MKFISWNVNGLRACATKGFEDSFKALDSDFFCLQETKMQHGQLDLQFDGYQSFLYKRIFLSGKTSEDGKFSAISNTIVYPSQK